MSHKTYFNWSTGKDSALALFHLLRDSKYDVQQLLTSVNSEYDRISMHGLRRSLLEIQAKSIGIPLSTIELPKEPTMEKYNSILSIKMTELKYDGFTHTAFGDIFLEDLRNYREDNLKAIGIESVFPLWKRNTTDLMTEFLELGFKTIVVCINEDVLDKSFVGRIIDQFFLDDLPANVDPCGENGEFHTFCFDGPIFSKPIDFEIGEIVYKTYPSPKKDSPKDKYGFWFCDIIPKI